MFLVLFSLNDIFSKCYMKNKNYFTHIIPSGEKRSSKFFFRPFLNCKKISYDVIFSESSFYCTARHPVINQLFGLSYGLFNVVIANFKWRPSDHKMEIFASVLDNNKKRTYSLTKLNLNIPYKFTITKHKDFFSYSIFDPDGLLISYYKIAISSSVPNYGQETFLNFQSPGAHLLICLLK